MLTPRLHHIVTVLLLTNACTAGSGKEQPAAGADAAVSAADARPSTPPSVDAGATTPQFDAGPSVPGPDAGPPAPCALTQTLGNVTFADQMVFADETGPGKVLVWLGEIAGQQAGLEMALYEGYGPFANGPLTNGTFAITGDELDPALCGVCLALSTFSDMRYLVATGGQVTLTSVAGTLAGSVSNLSFAEVDELGQVVPNGCTGALSGGALSGMIEPSM